jgi:CubicO group peptidase (beta-lactamase class C family)
VKENTFYDLASLTKPLATTLSIMKLVGEGRISLENTMEDIFGIIPKDKEKITVMDLLSHSSGMSAYKPYFHDLQKIEGKEKRKQQLFKLIINEKLLYETGQKSLYSDLGFMMLGFIIEEISGESIDRFVEEKIFKPFSIEKDIFFRPINGENSANSFAPTENCPWRKRILTGEVSDENCYILGGVSGHAGLFGNVDGVLKICTFLLDAWKNKEKHPALSTDHLPFFFKRRGEIKGSTWALGFDTPNKEGSSAGQHFSEKSVGHLGFTGTSFWIDPERQLVVVLLSNRVHPSRENNKIKNFRPVFHDTVIECLGLT